jgi:hypothetical protein
MKKKRRITAGMGLLAVLVIGVLFVASEAPHKKVREASMEESKLVGVDTKNPKAMARWAHGTCRGQTIEHLASLYGVEPTLSAVAQRLSQHFPDEVRPIVARACEVELKKTEAKT